MSTRINCEDTHVHTGTASIDFGLLERLTDQVICSRCLRTGVRTPINQIVSRRHRPRTLCRDCQSPPDRSAIDSSQVVDFLQAWLSA